MVCYIYALAQVLVPASRAEAVYVCISLLFILALMGGPMVVDWLPKKRTVNDVLQDSEKTNPQRIQGPNEAAQRQAA